MTEPTRAQMCLRRLRSCTHGQDLIEYGVLIALIASMVLLVMGELGVKVPRMYNTAAEALPGGSGDPGNGNPGNGNPGNDKPVGNPGNGTPGGGNPGGAPGGGNPGRGGGGN